MLAIDWWFLIQFYWRFVCFYSSICMFYLLFMWFYMVILFSSLYHICCYHLKDLCNSLNTYAAVQCGYTIVHDFVLFVCWFFCHFSFYFFYFKMSPWKWNNLVFQSMANPVGIRHWYVSIGLWILVCIVFYEKKRLDFNASFDFGEKNNISLI